jgi:hypothetical protein
LSRKDNMSIDYVFSGPPGVLETPSEGLGLGADSFNGSLWIISALGNVPVAPGLVDKVAMLGQTANIANLMTYTARQSGLYKVEGYVISTVATSGTLVSMTAVYTDLDTTGSVTATVVTGGSSSASSTVYQGSVIVNVAVAGTIVLATTSYASTTYNVKARIIYLG